MHTELCRVDPEQPDPRIVARAAAVLRAGGLVAFPTETVYGLGADALNENAVRRIFEAKGRPPSNPLIVHVAGLEAARQLAADWPASAQALGETFWPGSLTLVVPKKELVPAIVTAGGPTVALRVPAHPVALALLRAASVPVAAPSANRSTRLSPTTAAHVLRDLGGRIDMILDGGPATGGLESTVLDVTTSPPRLLRPGLVTPQEIEAVIGPILRPLERPGALAVAPARSPGLMGKHYAPRAALECITGDARQRIDQLLCEGQRVGWLTFDRAVSHLDPRVTVVVMPSDAREYAAQLYARLHEVDALGVQRIVVELPPDTEEWLAIRDRLRRASAR